MKSIRLFSTAAVTLLMALMMAKPAFAVPVPPHNVYGAVQINGSAAPLGTSVEAKCGTLSVGSDSVRTLDGFGQGFSIEVLGDDTQDTPPPSGVKEGCSPGETINFLVNGTQATQTTTWQSASFTQVDLSVTTAATPTNTPTNTPVVPTNTPTNTPVPPTNTSVPPTNTSVPPTNTPVVPPTNTSVPPTNTPVVPPTNTSVPPTNTPTNTSVAPTSTSVPPTNTPVVPPTATNTPGVPTPPTVVPTATATNTSVAPTNTPVVPPTNTPVVPPTNTSVPPTNTPVVPPTNTSVPPTDVPTATATATPVPQATATVPPQGVTIPFTDNQGDAITVQIPAGAVTEMIELRYTDLDTSPTAPPAGFQFGGRVFDLDAFRNNNLLENFQFQQPIVIVVEYTDADVAGLDEATLEVRYYDPATGQWRTDGISNIVRDLANNRITFTVTHLTIFGIFGVPLAPTPTATALPDPVLTIGSVSAPAGGQALVPVKFQRGTTGVSTLVFSIDYDQSCLSFNPADANNNGIPDAITFAAPAGFTTAVSFSAADTGGELDFVISSVSSTLPDVDPLVTIAFTANCASAVNFSTNPAPSFGALGGASVTGSTVPGAVAIAAPPATNTPVPPATNTPVTPPATNTPVTPPATNTPVTPPATNTPVTPPTNTPVPPPTNTPVPAAVKFLISSHSGSKVGGVSYSDEDILSYDPTTGVWALVFDGSDVGINKLDLKNFQLTANGAILMSFNKRMTLPGAGSVERNDIVKFVPSSLGVNTAGTWELYFDGSDVGLSGSSEYIDAIGWDAAGRLLISTEGTFKANGLTAQDEDILAFAGSSWGANTAGTWSLYFDGTDVKLTGGDEDVDSVAVRDGKIYLTTKGKFSAQGSASSLSGDKNDIFTCTPVTLGDNTDCSFALVFNGDGLLKDIDAIALENTMVLTTVWNEAAAATADADLDLTAQYEIEADEAEVAEPDAELDEFDVDNDEDTTVILRYFMPVVVK